MNDFETIYYNYLENYSASLQKGDGIKFSEAVSNLPIIGDIEVEYGDIIRISTKETLSQITLDKVKEILIAIKPWRKGPYDIFGHQIQTEWESQIKWKRLLPHLPDLEGKSILDIGASSGYYMFQMLKYNPYLILGVDPSVAFYHQYLCLNHFIQAPQTYYLPCGFEELDKFYGVFDIIFCMGILYHQRSPFEALEKMRRLLKANGTLLLEGMYIPGDDNQALIPHNRYAKMRNVYFLPTLTTLMIWMERVGFYDLELISLSQTSQIEQHPTPWIRGESLKDFLNPSDHDLTVEGYPAPRRFFLKAKAKTY